MREFEDREGRRWTAIAREAPSDDYKGRFHLVFQPAGHDGEEVELRDVRWNSERTAKRTLETMSLVELRRRLRSATGRRLTIAPGTPLD